MEHAPEKKFPVSSKDYKLYEEVGEGVSATVYRALCVPLNEIVAIKVLDLEKCNNDLDGIRREVQTMSLTDHPNLLKAHCSFTNDHSLWVVMPYMAGGSCLHIMKSAYAEGFEEPVIATLLREVLKALVYLHSHGHIHRDVKAGNILLDGNGAVKLADFGVSACMFDTGDRQRSRNTFVGTPCWMAPEVMQQLHGYDFKADIWSFGITALELAHGHAPFSKYPPMKVLLMTLQNAPPGLDYERDKRFSKSFKEMVSACLVKDPRKRPSSEKLLKHHFFKHGRSNEYLAKTILDGLAPLGDRFRTLKAKEADFLVNNKIRYGDKEQMSQHEYIRGISGWNFNLEDLKNQAAIDPDDVSSVNDLDMNVNTKEMFNDQDDGGSALSSESKDDIRDTASKEEGGRNLLRHSSLPSFPLRPLQALKGYFDISEDEVNTSSPSWKEDGESYPEQLFQIQRTQAVEEQEIRECDDDNLERNCTSSRNTGFIPGQGQRFLSGSLIPERVYAQTKGGTGDGEREHIQLRKPPERNFSGPLLQRHKRNGDIQQAASLQSLGDTSEGTVVQHKGRFKVTSAEKAITLTNSLLNSTSGSPSSATILSSILPSLQNILHHNTLQRDQIIKLLKCVERSSGNLSDTALVNASDIPMAPSTFGREKELQSQVIQLQQRIGGLAEELQKLKMKNAQLERQLSVSSNVEDDRL
ncbi:serine/threonine-protein kinase BLUS1 isoform X2 [Nymphaea colorata]|uniref:serine/threonine-protein kinase BLUS1 isoform X2 n=1 Tax=Nymphaea colorata TaxID=210225 RepID=UPI00129E64A7|nr:serine/threonine-protein kinase BLUS1 isoform X2 [Nymphaea colorata]